MTTKQDAEATRQQVFAFVKTQLAEDKEDKDPALKALLAWCAAPATRRVLTRRVNTALSSAVWTGIIAVLVATTLYGFGAWGKVNHEHWLAGDAFLAAKLIGGAFAFAPLFYFVMAVMAYFDERRWAQHALAEDAVEAKMLLQAWLRADTGFRNELRNETWKRVRPVLERRVIAILEQELSAQKAGLEPLVTRVRAQLTTLGHDEELAN